MAKSTRKTSKKGATKKVVSKKSKLKKAMPQKKTTKKVAAKKTANKKRVKPTSKKSSSKTPVKKAAAKKIIVKKIAIKKAQGDTSATKKPVKKAIPLQKELNRKTARANDYSEMLEDANSATSKNENINEEMNRVNAESSEAISTDMHNLPVPPEKYARPADPYHGNTAIVKRPSNIPPSGKKPLWKK